MWKYRHKNGKLTGNAVNRTYSPFVHGVIFYISNKQPMNLFIRKTSEELLREAENEGGRGLKRVLGPWGLIALGVGVIIGAGLFSVTGIVAGEHTGPAIVISFAKGLFIFIIAITLQIHSSQIYIAHGVISADI